MRLHGGVAILTVYINYANDICAILVLLPYSHEYSARINNWLYGNISDVILVENISYSSFITVNRDQIDVTMYNDHHNYSDISLRYCLEDDQSIWLKHRHVLHRLLSSSCNRESSFPIIIIIIIYNDIL